MTPTLQAYLQGLSITVFTAVEFVLPSSTVRLLDGAGEVTFSGKTFVGKDATYGAMFGLEEMEEAVGTEAPRVRAVIAPPSDAAVALWTAPTVQESAVNVWAGGIDQASGAVIADPELLFVGAMDTASIRFGMGERLIELDVASAWERMFAVEEGHKMNNAFHQSVWPGEKGLEFATGVQRQLYWGTDTPAGQAVRKSPSMLETAQSNAKLFYDKWRAFT